MKTETKHLLLWGGGSIALIGVIAYFVYQSGNVSAAKSTVVTQSVIPPDLVGTAPAAVQSSAPSQPTTSGLNTALESTVSTLATQPTAATPASSSTIPQGSCGLIAGVVSYSGSSLPTCTGSVPTSPTNLAILYG